MGNRKWSDAEDELLRVLYNKEPTEKLASRLKRTSEAIKLRAHFLGIFKQGARAAVQSEPLAMSEYVRGFIGALIDGEGWIGYKGKAHRRPLIVVVNTSLPLLQHARSVTGVGSIGVRKKQREHYKTQYAWRIQDKHAFRLLSAIAPTLIVKKERADEVIRTVKSLVEKVQKTVPEFTCKHCGIKFKRNVYRHDKPPMYCSNRCKGLDIGFSGKVVKVLNRVTPEEIQDIVKKTVKKTV